MPLLKSEAAFSATPRSLRTGLLRHVLVTSFTYSFLIFCVICRESLGFEAPSNGGFPTQKIGVVRTKGKNAVMIGILFFCCCRHVSMSDSRSLGMTRVCFGTAVLKSHSGVGFSARMEREGVYGFSNPCIYHLVEETSGHSTWLAGRCAHTSTYSSIC